MTDGRDEITKNHFNGKVDFTQVPSNIEYVIRGAKIDADLAARLTGALDGSRVSFVVTDEVEARFSVGGFKSEVQRLLMN